MPSAPEPVFAGRTSSKPAEGRLEHRVFDAPDGRVSCPGAAVMRRVTLALALALGLAGGGPAAAQEGTRYQLYLHDPPPQAEDAPPEPAARGERRRWRNAARPTQRSGRVAYCNKRLHDDLDRCQANFGFGSTTYFRCERTTYERFGAGCTDR